VWTRAWLCLAWVGAVAAQPVPESPELALGFTAKKPVYAKQYLVSAAHPSAVDAGLAMLEQGGSAIDAAIAVQMVLNVVEPQSSGLGGGAFALYYDAATKAVVAYDGREDAPAAATPGLFLDAAGKPMKFADAVIGGRSVGVPGVLRALEAAHARYGKLPWAKLFQPAIDLAEKGYALTPRTSVYLTPQRFFSRDKRARELFFNADGSPHKPGDRLVNRDLADTFRRIAREGPDAFYKGDIARDIVAAVRHHATNPGTLTEDDLAQYHARVLAPLCGPYRAYRLCGMPPPSSGGITVLQIMESLERFDMKSVRPGSVEAVHLIAEAGRLAYADRDRYVADDRFFDVPIAGLVDPAYNHARAALIRPDKTMGRADPGTPVGLRVAAGEADTLELPSTSHFSIVDREGNAVSMTTSVESYFGSQIFVRGFFLNNQLTDFSLTPTDREGRPVANAVYPGKRPRSAMAPFFVFDSSGRLHMAIGSPGGPVILNYVAKTLVATLDWGMDLQSAVSLPNFGSRNGPTEIERGSAYEQLIPALKAMGHDIRTLDLTSGLHGFMRTAEGWQGAADPRREGIAKGR
jgi:gamma-glutamyltranspeptidase/glutathione hydrolase